MRVFPVNFLSPGLNALYARTRFAACGAKMPTLPTPFGSLRRWFRCIMSLPSSSAQSFMILSTNAVSSSQGTQISSNAFSNRMAFANVPRSLRPTNLGPFIQDGNHRDILFGSKEVREFTTNEEGFLLKDTRLSLRDVLGLDPEVNVERKSLALSDKERVRIQNIQVVGHRGALYEHLENTLESFLFCAQCGCDAVELDVFVIQDGTLVVFHGRDNNPAIPGSLEGYCVGSRGETLNDFLLQKEDGCFKSIMDLTFAETQQLSFNPDFTEFPCPMEQICTARIPKLEEVLLALALSSSIKEIKIELKGPGTVRPVLELVESLKLASRCSYSSFDHAQLKELRSLRPDTALYRTGALFDAPVVDDYLDRATACGATAIHLRYDDCSMDRIHEIHRQNFVSMAWFRGPVGMKQDADHRFHDIGGCPATVNDDNTTDDSIVENKNCYRIMLETGVQQICCNRPDLLLRVIQERLA